MFLNPFHGRWPFFGATDKKFHLRELAEEVPFEELHETEKKAIDMTARAAQIAKELESKTSALLERSPFYALHVIAMFKAGATWADEHPVSDFNNRAERAAAMRNQLKNMLEGANAADDYMFEALSYAIFADGAHWADNNPAPTISV